MNYKSFSLGDWIGHISGVIEDETTLDGNEMRDLVEFLSTLKQEPCEDAVSRKGVLNTLDFTDKFLDETRTVESYKTLLEECYKNLPSVTPTTCIAKVSFSKEDMRELIDEKMKEIVVERKKGKWIKVTNGRDGHECNICHEYAPSFQNGEEYLSNYCHNCGAEMVGKE